MSKLKETLTEKQKKIIAVLCFLSFILFSAVVTWYIGVPMIKFVEQPEQFRVWVDSHGFFGKLAFIGMVIFQVLIAFVPGEPLEIVAGYAFGAVEGTILCVIGITIGSMLVFLLVRKFGVMLVEVFFSREKIRSLRFLKSKKSRSIITFLVFFLPGTPKDLLTYFVGLTDIKMGNFLLLASLARLPSIITSTVGGDALGLGNYIFAVIVFAVAVVLSLIGYLIYTAISRKRSKNR
ncbi:MAG: TVP38/TMEM64 family protein [Clostridia bacterium]|nr:TVP38/TMEM64 family protein [Clostridia bacterium]